MHKSYGLERRQIKFGFSGRTRALPIASASHGAPRVVRSPQSTPSVSAKALKPNHKEAASSSATSKTQQSPLLNQITKTSPGKLELSDVSSSYEHFKKLPNNNDDHKRNQLSTMSKDNNHRDAARPKYSSSELTRNNNVATPNASTTDNSRVVFTENQEITGNSEQSLENSQRNVFQKAWRSVSDTFGRASKQFIGPHLPKNNEGAIATGGESGQLETKHDHSIGPAVTSSLVASQRSKHVPDDITQQITPLCGAVGCGYVNLGNTCFMNSTLQCLSHCWKLVAWLQQYRVQWRRSHGQSAPGFDVCWQLAQLFEQALSNNQYNSISPRIMAAALNRISPHLHWGAQEDAHEYLSQLLDAMENHAKAANIEICRLMRGQFVSRVECAECGAVSDTHDPMETLSLEIHDCSDIDAALRHFTAAERLEGENAYQCERCNKRVSATKQMHFEELPDILVLHLKRFSATSSFSLIGGKDHHFVGYPAALNIHPYVVPERRTGLQVSEQFVTMNGTKTQASAKSVLMADECSYQLRGLVVHAGEFANMGHYVSYLRFTRHMLRKRQRALGKIPDISSPQYYCMNDSFVSSTSKEAMFHQEAYLLFYERAPPAKATHASYTHPNVMQSNLKQCAVEHSPRYVPYKEESSNDNGGAQSNPKHTTALHLESAVRNQELLRAPIARLAAERSHSYTSSVSSDISHSTNILSTPKSTHPTSPQSHRGFGVAYVRNYIRNENHSSHVDSTSLTNKHPRDADTLTTYSNKRVKVTPEPKHSSLVEYSDSE